MTYNDKTGYYETEINGKAYFIRKKDMEQLKDKLCIAIVAEHWKNLDKNREKTWRPVEFPDEITQDNLSIEERKQVKEWFKQGYKEVREKIEKSSRL